MGDIEVVAHEGRLHVFYLNLMNHDAVGHIVSDDGIHWQPMPVAIRTGDPGDCDADHIWTMGVFRRGDTWHMLYTALSQRGLMQRVALATSPDLVAWTKHPGNPIIDADPRWYEAEVTPGHRVDWRDPHVVEGDDGVLHGFIAARTNTGPLNRRGCAGHFTSADGLHWTVTPPVYVASNCFDWEVPSVFRIGDRWYMVAIAGGCGRCVWRVADDLAGPWRRMADDLLLPGLNMAARPCVWRGEVHLLHWVRGRRDWGEWPEFRALGSPKRAWVSDDGELFAESFDWSGEYVGGAVRMAPDTPAVEGCGEWSWSGGALRGSGGAAIRLFEQEFEDYELTADFELDPCAPACEFGLVLRADETGDRGLFATAAPGRFATELVKYEHKMYPNDRLGRGRSIEQSCHLRPDAAGLYQLRAVVHGPSVELNVNGRLVIGHMTMPRRAGRAGVFLEDGRARIKDIRLQPLRPPTSDWQ